MSEYQYYEFQAVDRPLSEEDRRALRGISTRARITTTHFTNSYQWGDFKGDPVKFMERWFDLHLYLANWGDRRLMIRLPKRLVDRDRLDAFLRKVDCATLTVSGENLILSIQRGEIESEDEAEIEYDEEEEEDYGSGWLDALAPLRDEVLGGDLRLFYLLWLTAVEDQALAADEREPLAGIGPLSAALTAFAKFFAMDVDLVQAAAERPAATTANALSTDAVREILAKMPAPDKTAILLRLFEGDPHVGAELRARVRGRQSVPVATPPASARTVGELRKRARAIGVSRHQAAAAKRAAEEQRRAREAERARQTRLIAVAQRGESVWRDIEADIERRNAAGYDRAASLLRDLQEIAKGRGTIKDFRVRLHAIRERHANKGRFLERLKTLG